MNGTPNYNILYVDYNDYALVYSCFGNVWFGTAIQEDLWVLSRTNTVTDSKLKDIRAKIKEKMPSYDIEKNGILTD